MTDEIKKECNTSENINELAAALAKAQGELKPAAKDKQNPFFKSSYADLAGLWGVIREPFSKNGLAIVQLVDCNHDNKIGVTTMLMHSSGQWIKERLLIPPVKNDPPSMGSAITYARRYGLGSITGAVSEDEDDDAEGSINRGSSPVIDTKGTLSRLEEAAKVGTSHLEVGWKSISVEARNALKNELPRLKAIAANNDKKEI